MDFLDANRNWGDMLGLTYPLLSDGQRAMSRAYQSLYDDPEMVKGNRVGAYMRSKRSWFVIDKQGIIRYIKIESPTLIPGDDLLEIVKKYNQ